MFLSPRFGPAAPVLAWVIFGVAMLAAGLGVVYLVTTAMYAEWMVTKFRVTGLIAQAACGTAAMLSVFAYAYWMALLVPRAAAAYKRQSANGRIIVRLGKQER